MRGLARKPGNAGDQVIDSCADICSTTKACLFLEQRRKCVDRDVDSKVQSAVEPDPVLTLVSRAPSLKLGSSKSGEIKTAAKDFTDKMGALLAKKKATV